MDIETQTENAMRTLSVVYHDVSKLLNRSTIKRWLSDLEKSVSKAVPDFVVLKGCCRYILFELNRKEWCKYYFLSVEYAPNQPITRSHIVLSRYPLVRAETFGNPANHLIEIKIPFNDVPMRYEYEDLDVQQINVDSVVLLITENLDKEDKLFSQHSQTLDSSLQTICSPSANPPTVMLFGVDNLSPLFPSTRSEWEYCDSESLDVTNPPNPSSQKTQKTQKTSSKGVCYLSQSWEFVEYIPRTGLYQFHMINFD